MPICRQLTGVRPGRQSDDARGYRSTAVYDNAGQPVAQIDALAFRTASLYDDAGRSVALINARGYRSTSVYDNVGQVTAAIDALGNRHSFVHDAAGRPTATLNPLGFRTSQLYDQASRVVATQNALGNRTSFSYDAKGQQVAVLSPLGFRTSQLYDAAARPIAQINALGNRTTTMFDAVGNTQALIDARSNRHSFVYDAANRELALIDPLNRRTTSGYDKAGNQTLRIDARGNRTTYSLDAGSQLTGRRYPDGSRVTFAWDETGNRTLLVDATGRTTWLYDALSRTRVNRQPNSKTITYSYDPVGNRATMRDPDGGRFTYAHDPASRLSGLENPWNERTTFSYDAASRRTLKKLANGTRASFSYDAADRLTALANMDSTAAYISRYDYKYDDADNRTAVLEADGSRVTWSYDAANQLLAENRTGTTPYVNTFSYDAAQNRLTKNESGSPTTYSYDAANQLETSLDASGTTTYTFDANGNQQIVEAPNGGRTSTTWDYENQPTKTVLPSGVINTASYNGDNLRKELQDSEGTKRFVWDGTQYLLQTDETNVTQAVWTNEPAEFTMLLSQRRDSATQYPHFDAIGSTRQLTTVADAVTDIWLYDAWGKVLTHAGTARFPLMYVGRYGYFMDRDTTSTYVIVRIYHPLTARWWSVDPAPIALVTAAYVYSSDNPLTYVDPFGLFAVPSIECKGRCGVEIGSTLRRFLAQFRRTFHTSTIRKRHRACRGMVGLNGWDIAALFTEGGGGSRGGRPTELFVQDPCGTPKACVGSVTVDGHCYWAAEVNYVLWGFARRLCDTFWRRLYGTYFTRFSRRQIRLVEVYRIPWGLDFPVWTLENSKRLVTLWRRFGYGYRDLFESSGSCPSRRSHGSGIPGRHAWTEAGWTNDFRNAIPANIDSRCDACSKVYRGGLSGRIGTSPKIGANV